jgi:hypothetical protein
MPLTIADLRNDLRFLAEKDGEHGFPKGASDSWFASKDYILLSERAPDGTPLVGTALTYPYPCPVDPTADVRIHFWLANLERPDELPQAFVKSIVAINAEMEGLGAQRVWGVVAKSAKHLTRLLDPVVAAGKCQRVDGATVTLDGYEGGIFRKINFYIGDRSEVTDFVRGLP